MCNENYEGLKYIEGLEVVVVPLPNHAVECRVAPARQRRSPGEWKRRARRYRLIASGKIRVRVHPYVEFVDLETRVLNSKPLHVSLIELRRGAGVLQVGHFQLKVLLRSHYTATTANHAPDPKANGVARRYGSNRQCCRLRHGLRPRDARGSRLLVRDTLNVAQRVRSLYAYRINSLRGRHRR